MHGPEARATERGVRCRLSRPSFAKRRAPPGPRASGEQENQDPKHFGEMVAYADKQVGSLVARLEQLGLRENPLLIVIGDREDPRSVYPSGLEWNTASAPTLPAAPPRFSTTKGCPSLCRTCSVRMRVAVSIPPPAATATTTLTGRFG